jgi:ferric-dicitrate binding protein FerR (iron transport regulator)
MNGDPDDELGALLRAAGRRDAPPADVAAAIRAAAHAEWRTTVAARTRERRRRVGYALAAGIAVLAVAAIAVLGVRTPASTGATVARLERAGDGVEMRAPGAAWATRPAGAPLVDGIEVRTGAHGGAALAWSTGAGVRFDANSSATLRADRIVLDAGAVYVDGDAANGRGAPVVATPLGVVQHLGTRYEVRYSPAGLRVTVRNGRIAIANGPAPVEAATGERLTVAPDGLLARERVPAFGADWAWLDALAPGYAIEGRTVEDFVDWAARETGRVPEYATPEARETARRVVLRGSIDGLGPEAALPAVLTTTRLDAVVRDGRVVVGFRDDSPAAVR